jgi:hypothetical protein
MTGIFEIKKCNQTPESMKIGMFPKKLWKESVHFLPKFQIKCNLFTLVSFKWKNSTSMINGTKLESNFFLYST